MGYCNFAITLVFLGYIMNLSAMPSALKMIKEVMNLLNDIEVRTYVCILSL